MKKRLNTFIEHTNLKPTLTDREIETLINEVKQYSFAGICVPPFWIKKVSRDLQEEDVRIVTVAGFPLGYSMTETKIEEIKLAIKNGATKLIWS